MLSPRELRRARIHALLWFLVVNAAVGILIGHGFVASMASQADALGWLFVHVALIGQVGLVCLLLTLPLVGIACLGSGGATILALGPLLFTVLHVFIYLDRVVYSMFRFHLNGLAYNVLTTPGGFESMRLSGGDVALFVVGCTLGLVAEVVLLRRLVGRFTREPSAAKTASRRWAMVTAVVVAFGLADRLIYATADLRGAHSITRLARAIPLYQPMTMKRLASRFMDVDTGQGVRVKLVGEPSALAYPAQPLAYAKPQSLPNIVWVVLDSWRYDSFDAEVTPNIWAFSQRATVFENHLATGNATRFGIFGMFYGLHGSYWHHMLSEQRGPVLVSRLRQLGYRFKVITPSPLTFPEFRRTVFVDVRSSLSDDLPGETLLERHVQTVETFEDFAATADRSQPFFSFMFFDSTHAPYDFPPDRAPFTPFAESVNYGAMGLAEQRHLIVNRYKNAIHYLDHLTQRVIDALTVNELIDDTIVLITGDHGEEFNEHGFWGHNSAFTPEQIHVPLILFQPGREPERAPWVTSHQDLVPTFMGMLGVTNPPQDYSNGQPLYEKERDVRVVACGWDECSWIHEDGHIVFGTQTHRAWGVDVLGTDYKPHPDADSVLARRAPELAALAGELSAFLQK